MYVLRAMCLCLAVVVVFSHDSSKVTTGFTRSMFESCIAETKMSEEAQKSFNELKYGIPQTQPEKCMVGCLFRKANLISNGKYSEEALSVMAHDWWKNQTDANQVKSLLQVCANKAQSAGTDECTLGGVFLPCVQEEVQKAGLPLLPCGRC